MTAYLNHPRKEDKAFNYNSKFKELSNKITNIASQAKEVSSECSRLESKLNNVESKCQLRFQALDQKFTLVKDTYTKITKQYEDNIVYQKQLRKTLQSKQLEEKISNQIAEQRAALTSYLESVFGSIEVNITKILSLQEEESSELRKEASDYQQEASNSLSSLSDRIQKEKSEQVQQIKNIVNDSNKEFINIHEEIKKEAQANGETSKEFLQNCKEVKEKMNDEFIKAKVKREEFEENIFNLIEDTCVKLSETSS